MIATLLLSLQASGYGLPVDPLLDKPLAIEARIEPLPELLARVGTSLGVKLSVERRMEPLKATVFCAARPGRLTLAGLASVFDAEWVATGGGYRLEETVPARNARRGYLAGQEAHRRKAVDAYLREGEGRGPGLPGGEAGAGFGRLLAEARERYGAAGPIEREQFLDGGTMNRIGRDLGAPAEEPREIRNRAGTMVGSSARPERPPGPTLMLLRARPDRGGVQALAIGGAFRGSTDRHPEIDTRNPNLGRTSFDKAQAAWALEWWKSDAPELRSPLRTFEPVRPPWAGGRWTDSDALEALHRASGMPVVAEAFRSAEDARTIPTSGTLGQALRSAGLWRGLRFEAGELLHRPGEFLRMRAVEPTEAAMARFERESEPTPEGLGEMFAGMPPRALGDPWRIAARRAIPGAGPGAIGPWVLRLWGSLSPKEREAALRPEGIALDRIRRGDRVHETIEETLFGLGRVILRPDGTPGREAATAIALLGLGPGGPFTLRAERGVVEPPGLPNARVSKPAEVSKGLVLRIVDAEGRGLLLFAPV